MRLATNRPLDFPPPPASEEIHGPTLAQTFRPRRGEQVPILLERALSRVPPRLLVLLDTATGRRRPVQNSASLIQHRRILPQQRLTTMLGQTCEQMRMAALRGSHRPRRAARPRLPLENRKHPTRRASPALVRRNKRHRLHLATAQEGLVSRRDLQG